MQAYEWIIHVPQWCRRLLQPVTKMLRHSHGEKRPFLLQIALGHRSVKYNTDLPPPSHSKLFLQVWVWSCIASNFDKGWSGNHKDKIMDRPFMPKYGTVSQVLLQLVVALILLYFFALRGWNKDFRVQWVCVFFRFVFLVFRDDVYKAQSAPRLTYCQVSDWFLR